MKKKLFVLAAVTLSSQLHAQQDTTSMDEVVLTANKFEQKQSQTGKVVTVITKEQLEKSSGKSLGQVLNEQVGVTIPGALNAMGSVQSVYMRGASSGRTMILIDGIPVNDHSMINNEFDLNLLSIYDIERIEILRGSQSTLYGSDAIAGAINIITVKKDVLAPTSATAQSIAPAFRPGIKATSAYGSRNTSRSNVQLFGKINNKLSYTTRFARIVTDGFSSATDNNGTGTFDDDGYNGNIASASLQYQVIPTLSVKGFIQNSQYKADVDRAIFVDDKDFTINNSNLMAGGTVHFKKGIANIIANYQYGKQKRRYLDDSLDYAPTGTKFESNNYNAKSKFAELYGNVQAANWLTVLAGLDYREGSMDQQYQSIHALYGPYESEFQNKSLDQFSAYTSFLFNTLNKKLNVELGGRFNRHSRYGDNTTYTFNPSYSISNHWRVFGSIASGFKAPSIYQVYDEFSGNPALKPEESTNFEIGVQQSGSKVSSRAVYFHRNIRDGIDYNYVTFQYFNFVRQEVSGLELELELKPVRGFNIRANYALITGEEQTQSRKNFSDTSYDYLLRRPKHNLNISLGYQVCPEFYISLSGKAISDRYDVGGFMSDDIELDGYFLLNAYAEYKYGSHIKFFADLQNITDKKFADIRGYNAIPFLITGGVGFNW